MDSAATQDRYGTRRSGPSRGVVAAAVVLAGALAAWALWATIGAAGPSATGDVLGFTIADDHAIDAHVALGGRQDAREVVVCTVQALDKNRDVVGVTTARGRLRADGSRSVTVRVRTRDRAVTAVVSECSTRAH